MKTLITWIDSHGTAEPTRVNCDGKLTVACWCSNAAGEWFIEVSSIAATLKAARDWLGY